MRRRPMLRRGLSRPLGLGHRSLSLVVRPQSRREFGRHGSRHMGAGAVGRAVLVGRMALESVRGRDRRSSAGADSLVVVVGSLVVVDNFVGKEEHRRVVVEGEGCWHSLVREGIAGLLERNWVGEDIAAGRRVVEGPVADHRRSNRYLTLWKCRAR